jgi:hypothetical protein
MTRPRRERAPALERQIEWCREIRADHVAGWYEALLADTPEARTVRKWFKKNARPSSGSSARWGLRCQNCATCRELRLSGTILDCQNCADWEVELYLLVDVYFQMVKPVSARERAGQPACKRKAEATANKARELATLLKHEAGPQVPSVLALFHPDRAVDIIRDLPPWLARSLLSQTGYSEDPGEGYERAAPPPYNEDGFRWSQLDPAANLARRFGGVLGLSGAAQLLPDLLARLADYIEANADWERPRLKNPNAHWRDARAFAHALAGGFWSSHDARPHAVIAALVAIKHPDLAKTVRADNTPLLCADTMKDWLKHYPLKPKKGRSVKNQPNTSPSLFHPHGSQSPP